MKIKVSTLKRTTLILGIAIIGVGLFAIGYNNTSSNPKAEVDNPINTPVIEGNKQILDLTAKNGYSPAIINAKADMAAVLKVKTNTTFDCSSALTIPKLNVSKNLPPSGITEIEIPAQKPGTVINGTCSMGMYNFKIQFT